MVVGITTVDTGAAPLSVDSRPAPFLGSALAAPRYYYDDPGYYYGPEVYAGPGPDAEAYCEQRYRSYDPASGTYLGYDGLRHPFP
jgi:hypothetical protein